MRIVIVGATNLAVETARILLGRSDEVVIIETDADRIAQLEETLGCAFIHGDGSDPDILQEAAPKQTDVLFCLTNDDKTNIIASVLGRSIGFDRVVPTITNSRLRGVCNQLGLKDTTIPAQTIARYLADFVRGHDVLELSTVIKGEARFLSFQAEGDIVGKNIGDIELPDSARIVCYYRKDAFHLAEDDARVKKGDEVVILTHSKSVEELRTRFHGEATEEEAPGPGDEEES